MTSGPPVPRSVCVVGDGRAGGSFAGALARVGWEVVPPRRHGDPVADAAHDVALVIVATPDAVVADVAARIEPVGSTVVAHVAGSLALDVLRPHPRRASIHPLVPLPDPGTGAARLAGGTWFAVAGSGPGELSVVQGIVADLGGRAVAVADADRVRYHAAACIAANHLVALLGQVERVAASVGVPLDAYLALARAGLTDVSTAGAQTALTGPVARGDWDTVARHLEALPAGERDAYRSLALAAHRLATGSTDGAPTWLRA